MDTLDEVDTDDDVDTELEVDTLKGMKCDYLFLFEGPKGGTMPALYILWQ